jgi:hypothetical protein
VYEDYGECQCTVVAFSIVVVRENNKLSGLEKQQQHIEVSIVHMFFIQFSLKTICKPLHHHQHYWNILIMFPEYHTLIMNQYQNQHQQQ